MHTYSPTVVMEKIYIPQTLLILFLGSVTSSSYEGNEADNLPTCAVPSHYSLYLTLDPEDSTYNGSIQIDFSATTTVNDVIKLHASPKTIKIHSTLLNYNHSCTVTSQDNDTEIVTLTCPTRSFRVQNTLVIRFQGKVTTEDQVGLFRTTYKEDGDEHVMLSTEFEPVVARQAFPCFDEPKWKTTFDIFITHPKKYIALANTPVKKQFPIAPDRIQTQFQTTPLMSVYLLAFAVSKFVSSSYNATRGYDYRVFTRPSAKEFTSVAVTYGPILIDLLGNWTDIAYKDLGDAQAYQIAIPNVDDGAMENWGLITFGEVDLLDEKEITSNFAKQNIIALIAHELAHQWFGNYVTMNWWSNIWLNEGYATYFQHYIVDQLEDNLEMMKQFVVNILQPVLEVDAVSESLPLSSDVNNREDSEGKFDDISYSKGASIIRMLRNVIGEAAFREGTQSYLSTYKYNNTYPSVLLNSFKAETPLGLDKVMYNWIYKAGFPLVTARLNGSKVTLTQERFDSSESTQWYIPISYTTKTESNFNVNVKGWLVPNSTLDIELEDGSWIILNMQQTGYYRVNYDDILWQRIIEALKNDRNSINVINRSQLVNDVFNIARAGSVSYRTAFHLAEYLRYETEYYPWVSAFNAMSFISGKLADDEAERLLQFRILYWLNKAFAPNKPNTGTSHVDKLKEVLVLAWACKLGQEQCIAYANETFQKYKTSYSLPDNNKRGVVFCYGFRNSSHPAEDYDFLFKLYKNSTSPQQKIDILSSLGCTKNTDLLSKYLTETIKKNSPIRKQDAISVFETVYTKSDVGVNVSLTFLENNLKNFTTRFQGTDTLPTVLLGLADIAKTDTQIKRIAQIVKNCRNIGNVKNIMEYFVNIIVANRLWRNKHATEIKTILQEPIVDTGNFVKPSNLFIFAKSVQFLNTRVVSKIV